MKVYIKSHSYGQRVGQNWMPLQSKQIWFEEQQESNYLGCRSKIFDLFSVQHFWNQGKWKERGEKRAICLCCPLAICKWSILRPRGLCLCVFVCVCVLCVLVFGLRSMMWCNLLCPRINNKKHANLYIFCREMIKWSGRDIVYCVFGVIVIVCMGSEIKLGVWWWCKRIRSFGI